MALPDDAARADDPDPQLFRRRAAHAEASSGVDFCTELVRCPAAHRALMRHDLLPCVGRFRPDHSSANVRANGEAHGGRGPIRRHAHRREHMRGLDGADHAGRAARDSQAGEIKRDKQILTVQPEKTDVQRIGQSLFGMAVAAHTAESLQLPATDSRSTGAAVRLRPDRRSPCSRSASAMPAIAGRVLCAGAPFVFVRAAFH